jgi:hypothetical protein
MTLKDKLNSLSSGYRNHSSISPENNPAIAGLVKLLTNSASNGRNILVLDSDSKNHSDLCFKLLSLGNDLNDYLNVNGINYHDHFHGNSRLMIFYW